MQRVNLSVAIVSMVDTKKCINESFPNTNLTVEDFTNLSVSFESNCRVISVFITVLNFLLNSFLNRFSQYQE